MDVMFYGIPGLIMAGVLFMAYCVLRRWTQIRGAWASGLTARARCLRTYTTTHGGGHDTSVRTRLHHVYEFSTHDGRVIRFEEENGRGTILEGDFVTVHYTDGPRVRATAHAPSRGKHAAATFGVLAFLGVIVVFCVSFMVVYTEMSAMASDVTGF
ncbi:hypothetical protein [Streptomyces sp. NPDC092370]|uniref:hypothetical protein n=1 Tax=Streptomyces sp. NPDC092370 TaxID=3366016 RepID=UPI00381C802C